MLRTMSILWKHYGKYPITYIYLSSLWRWIFIKCPILLFVIWYTNTHSVNGGPFYPLEPFNRILNVNNMFMSFVSSFKFLHCFVLTNYCFNIIVYYIGTKFN